MIRLSENWFDKCNSEITSICFEYLKLVNMCLLLAFFYLDTLKYSPHCNLSLTGWRNCTVKFKKKAILKLICPVFCPHV